MAFQYSGNAYDIGGGHARHACFLLHGLKEVSASLSASGLPFFLLRDDDDDVTRSLVPLLRDAGACLLVADVDPLREARERLAAVVGAVDGEVEVHEVDAHNVVPLWAATDKEEFAARTIRPRINRQLHEWLVEMPTLEECGLESLAEWPASAPAPPKADWEALIGEAASLGDGKAAELKWVAGGEKAAAVALADYLRPERLRLYADKRNDPTCPQALSGLSPWLRHGHISAQRCALEATKNRQKYKAAVDGFVEELVIRRELADNFVWYQPKYDSLEGAKDWAKLSHAEHKSDKRAHLYTRVQLEGRKTHDPLWNAAQRELSVRGKMHGYLRMYWAKKILEWTEDAETALSIGLYLNDKYSIDGRCPNGFVGVMWSVVGIHDRAWGPVRPVFGKIRYMNDAGCKRKFDVPRYIAYCDALKP